MNSRNDTLDEPVRQMLDRGKKTLETVLTRAGSGGVEALHTATNELAYLIGVARLAIEALGTGVEAAEKPLHEARLRGLARMAELRRMAEPVLETGEVCSLLGVSRETVRKKVDRRQVLALPKGGDRVFPAFQFRDGEILPGIAPVLAALDTDSPFVILSFLLSPNERFGGQSACDLLGKGDWEPVLTEARLFLEHGS
jgi:hypothetical protein